jgi:hypothetical protein
VFSSVYFVNSFNQADSSKSTNIFDNLPDLAAASNIRDELDIYLATNIEDMKDALMWWFERHSPFPCLSWMARDYLSIPGMDEHELFLTYVTLLRFLAQQLMSNECSLWADSSCPMSTAG